LEREEEGRGEREGWRERERETVEWMEEVGLVGGRGRGGRGILGEGKRGLEDLGVVRVGRCWDEVESVGEVGGGGGRGGKGMFGGWLGENEGRRFNPPTTPCSKEPTPSPKELLLLVREDCMRASEPV